MPYTSKSKYKHHRQLSPKLFERGTMKTVPLSHTKYRGKKFKKKNVKAVIGRLKGCNKYCWVIQSVLVPKKKK